MVKALRDSGVSVTAKSEYDAGTKTAGAAKYSLQLNGKAGETYDVAAGAKAGEFVVSTKSGVKLGTLTAGGFTSKATDAGDLSETVNLNANTVKAAAATTHKAAYYDKDGNRIAENDLDNYFSTTYTGKTTATGTTAARADAKQVYDAVGNKTVLKKEEVSTARDKVGALSVGLHVGADATGNNQIAMNIESMSAKGLGITGLKMDGTDDTNAMNAIEKIKAAISKVSAQRSDLGAVQNRLEHTINNLDNVVENTTSAESAIRDTDMASEMVKYSNNNILAQAGTSMLAQANQSNQSVLSLLG